MKTLIGTWLVSLIAASAAVRPNFILILADDMGWNEAGFCGAASIDTPHLDRLAKEGVVFPQACASAPNCAPTRACLLSGLYPPRHGVYTVVDERHAPGSPHHRVLAAESRAALPAETSTLAEALKPAGYATGMFGMWNLGRGRSGPTTPTGQGFDVFVEPRMLGFEKDEYRDASGRYSPDVLTDSALKWMESVRNKPFFLYLAFHDVHAPHDPKPELLAKYQARVGVRDPALAATVEGMDANIGRLLKALEDSGVAGRTHVIFTSDNGGARGNVAPLRGGKGSLYQGGLRVPAVVRGPGIRSGVSSDATILSMDWFPTVMELAGWKGEGSPAADGQSLVPLLRDGSRLPERDVFWHFPCYIGGAGPCSAIRSGEWKLIEFFESGTSELYHLPSDPGESRDLSDSESGKSRELLSRLHAWQANMKAPRPTLPNPAYDPSSSPRQGREPKGAGGKRGRKPHPAIPSGS